MRVAKQKKSEDVLTKAQNMAIERNKAVVNGINDQTGGSLVKAMNADREMNKSVVMQGSALGRRNKVLNKNEAPQGQRVIVETAKQPDMRMKESMQNMAPQTKRRVQAPNPMQNALSSADKIAAEKGPFIQRQYQAPVQDGRKSVAGVNHNPAEEARRRRKVEARIRELAKQ
jgi:hypothetical protein